ncbi:MULTISPECIES: hypothetical protein [Pseudomonas]|uniref:hypothetical protein n=1 Tax=Pseudomonas TaxID=286 RepID=UPI0031DC8712
MAYSQIILVGKGKLAAEVWSGIELPDLFVKLEWGYADVCYEQSIIIHAGSGRELPEIIEFCAGTKSVLIELSTGSVLEGKQYPFPIVICHNANILMLKFLQILSANGHMFSENFITVLESHQSTKESAPGTALHIAKSLGLQRDDIRSVRDQELQISLGVPLSSLERHALHRITITDGVCDITFESRILGGGSYAPGVSKIVSAVASNLLENRTYLVDEFVVKGWI